MFAAVANYFGGAEEEAAAKGRDKKAARSVEPPTDKTAAADGDVDKPVLDAADEDATHELLQQFSVLLEYERLQDLMPTGMYVAPSYESILVWHGTIFVQHGLYRGGVFKFKIDLSEDYPETEPQIHFLTKVFHPLVDPASGLFDSEFFFPEWTVGKDFISCVLPHVYRLFNSESYIDKHPEPLNAEALDLYKAKPADFAKKADECAKASHGGIYKNPTGTSLQFSKNPADAHDKILEQFATLDSSVPLEERTGEFADWFCDYYAKQRTQLAVDEPHVEVVAIPPRCLSLPHRPSVELDENGKLAWAPQEGWASHDSSEEEASEDDEHDGEGKPAGKLTAAQQQEAKQLKVARVLKKAQKRFRDLLEKNAKTSPPPPTHLWSSEGGSSSASAGDGSQPNKTDDEDDDTMVEF
eukprot:TRINITY_DN51253_c0_g1_i1.p1 TRINITY_DN51253_c0_g1~~TRINITY_DN51253_c0_g1_i1.p1  ORF type:complete len:412 (-),score=90.10 TRINITY_DN51253_c0_g1_i1:86-1321(-)